MATKKKVPVKKTAQKDVPPLKLDLGCGKNKREGFFGIDAIKFDNVDLQWNLAQRVTVAGQLDPQGRTLKRSGNADFAVWPFEDNSVDEAFCSHFIEHLTWPERVHFFNELYRVLKPGAACTLIWPYWCSSRFYGDPTHKEPMSEMALLYLNKQWRDANAPHVGYTCDFNPTWGYALHPELVSRPSDYQQNALAFWKEAAQDVHATLTKPAAE